MSTDSQFTVRRQLDEVRAAALHEAVLLMSTARNHTVGDVIKVAAEFERWLAGTDEATT